MRPNVSRLSVDSYDGFETFGGGQWRAVSEMQEIVILEPLR